MASKNAIVVEFLVTEELINQVSAGNLDKIGDLINVNRVVDTLVYESDNLYRERVLKEWKTVFSN